MNDLLASRYSELFAGYGIGSDPALLSAKGRIAEVLQTNPDWLRPDAAYALLVNVDHMIRIPCSGYVPKRGDIFGQPLDVHISPSEIEHKLHEYLSSLFTDLEKNEEPPISSHAVLRAVDRNWAYAAGVFFW